MAAALEQAPDVDDARTIATIVGHELACVAGGAPARRRRNDHACWCRRHGRAELVELVRSALLADGGATMRSIARAQPGAMRDAAAAAAVSFVRAFGEHEVSSSLAASLMLRAAVMGAVADALLARVLAGAADPATARTAAALATAARIDTLTALQVERGARDARAAQPVSWPAVWATAQQAEQPAELTAGAADGGADGSHDGGDE
jgi:hypothetical protein